MIEETNPNHPVTRDKLLRLGQQQTLGVRHSQRRSFVVTHSEDPVDGLQLELPGTAIGLSKRLSLDIGPHLRNFWFNILICSEGPDPDIPSESHMRLKRYTPLHHARSDVLAMNNFMKNSFVLFHEIVFEPGARPGGGAFNEDIVISNPTSEELRRVALLGKEFFAANAGDPEWRGGQVNVFFSGHGHVDEATHDVAFVIGDGLLYAKELVDLLEQCCHTPQDATPWKYVHQRGFCSPRRRGSSSGFSSGVAETIRKPLPQADIAAHFQQILVGRELVGGHEAGHGGEARTFGAMPGRGLTKLDTGRS